MPQDENTKFNNRFGMACVCFAGYMIYLCAYLPHIFVKNEVIAIIKKPFP